MSFDILEQEINNGLDGLNSGIPIGFDRLNNHIGIRKRIYFLIGGNTGSGKTSFLDDAFVLNPYDWYISKDNNTKIKLRIIYRSMERSRVYKLAKWTVRKIFLDHGILIPISKLLTWNVKGERMTKDEHDLVLMYRDYINGMSDVITIIDGPENPVGVAKELREYALSRGKEEKIDKWNKIYIPDDSNEITLVILDTLNLLKTTKDHPTKKQAIDKMSDELRYARDFFNYTPVAVSQFNREISNIQRIKNGDVEPQLEDFKESAQTQEDADVVVSLFDAIRYKVKDPSGYDLNKLKDEATGATYFRSLRVLKNSYGCDNLRIGLAFLGEIGRFKELKKSRDMTDEDYENVINRSFFLEK
jgi:hypothetical protein